MDLAKLKMRWPWHKHVTPQLAALGLVKNDPVGFWNWVRATEFGPDSKLAKPNTINWFVPSIGRGSGGHLNIFRFVRYLELDGFECRIVVFDDANLLSAKQVKKNINEWFFPIKADVVFHPQQDVPPAAISVATGWQTAYPVAAFRGSRHRCYFVQDYEPWFYSAGSEWVFAEETYRLGLTGITAGDWLAQKLRADFGMTTHAVGFSYDRELYRRVPKRDDVPRVFFYARPPTPRRAFELGMMVLTALSERHPEIGVCLAGWDLSNYRIPFAALSAGLLSLAELPDLYSQCDAALVLSLTNASLLPLELMACGCVVVSNRGPNVEWLLNDDTAVLSDTRIDALVDALERAVFDTGLRSHIVENALMKVQGTDWKREADKMATIFRSLQQ
jgi:O-antigen biosynthesis protein